MYIALALSFRQMINTTNRAHHVSRSSQCPIMGFHPLPDVLASSHLHSVMQTGLLVAVAADSMHVREIIWNCKTLLLFEEKGLEEPISLSPTQEATFGGDVSEILFTCRDTAGVRRSPRTIMGIQLYPTTCCKRLNSCTQVHTLVYFMQIISYSVDASIANLEMTTRRQG